MNSNWYIYNKKKNVSEMSKRFNISPIASVILYNRDISEDDDVKKILSSNIDDINDAKLLPDVDEACELIHRYILEKKKIRIVGDYDIDGVCSTYIFFDTLKELGADVSYAIPDRISEGYGINVSIIDKAIDDKIDLIITCDNGIAAGEQILYAKNHGIKVIVTDHHDISYMPEDAAYVVNPKREDVKNPYPFKEICGAVVAWKVLTRYYEIYENNKKYIIDKYLEFAMLATIGDIMTLKNENHIIAKAGLNKILNTKNRGLRKLIEVSGLDLTKKQITAYHIGFIIGPLINAAGRMDKATTALRLFLSDDENEINDIAEILKKLNDERKNMTEDGTSFAISQVEEKFINDKVLVLYIKNLGEQVAGIVAGRIKDRYNKPTIILTDTSEDREAKASCRSIENYDIFEALSKHKDMFLKFGGHKLAAGFSILKEDIDELRKLLNEECNLSKDDFKPKVYIDLEYPPYAIDVDTVRELDKLAPFGQDFKSPTFATKNVEVSIKNIYGKDNNIVHLILKKDNKCIKGVAFTDSMKLKQRLSESSNLDIIYYPKINEYNGSTSVEISLIDYR